MNPESNIRAFNQYKIGTHRYRFHQYFPHFIPTIYLFCSVLDYLKKYYLFIISLSRIHSRFYRKIYEKYYSKFYDKYLFNMVNEEKGRLSLVS